MRSLLIIFAITFSASAFSQTWKEQYDSASAEWEKGNWPKVVSHLTKAEKYAAGDLGIYDPNYLTILNDLGLACANAGDTERAEALLQQCMTLRSEVLAPDDPEFISSFQNYATLISRHDPGAAISLYKKFSKEHPGQGSFCNLRIGELYQDSGYPDSAMYYFRTIPEGTNSITGYHQQLREIHLWLELGQFNIADSLSGQLIPALRQTNEKALLSAALREKGLATTELGNYQEAEKYLSEAATLLDNGPPSKELLNATSVLYARMGLTNKAIGLLEEAVRCAEAEGTGQLTLQMNLATLYEQTGRYNEALDILEELRKHSYSPFQGVNIRMQMAVVAGHVENQQKADTLLREALHICETNGIPLPLKGSLYANAGYAELRVGKLDDAEIHLKEALRIKSSLYGADAVQLTELKNNLGLVLYGLGKEKEGLRLMAEALEGIQRQVRYTFPIMTRREKMAFYSQLDNIFNRFNSMVVYGSEMNPDLIASMFNKQLLVKGLMMKAGVPWSGECAEAGELSDRLREYRFRLAVKYKSTLVYRNQTPADVSELEKNINEIEDQLASVCGGKQDHYSFTTWKQISESLSAGQALVDIIRVRDFRTKQGSESYQMGFSERVNYVGLVILPGKSPQVIRFDDGSDLEGRYFHFYQNSVKFDMEDTMSYEKFWKPLEHILQESRVVHVVNDGVFHKINLAGLKNPESGQYLIEEKDIRLLNNPSDLLSDHSPVENKTAYLLGDPVPAQITTPNGTYSLKALPETKFEVEAVGKMLRENGWDVNEYLGDSAVRETLLNRSGAAVIHLATHGFFADEFVTADSEVPDAGLLASGLIFSPSVSGEFILTAYEILGMPMFDTDLVVLSACETGLGEIRNGEGIEGLQRAFLSNGARSVLLSLWQVEDRSTSLLMQEFYKQYTSGKDKRTAFREAQLSMLSQGFAPKNWSAFVMIGK